MCIQSCAAQSCLYHGGIDEMCHKFSQHARWIMPMGFLLVEVKIVEQTDLSGFKNITRWVNKERLDYRMQDLKLHYKGCFVGGCCSVHQCLRVWLCECVCIQVDNGCFCSLYRLVLQDSVLSPRLPQVGSPHYRTYSVHCLTFTTCSDLKNHPLIWSGTCRLLVEKLSWSLLYFSTNSLNPSSCGKGGKCLFVD